VGLKGENRLGNCDTQPVEPTPEEVGHHADAEYNKLTRPGKGIPPLTRRRMLQ
jgi:hypothetical protein